MWSLDQDYRQPELYQTFTYIGSFIHSFNWYEPFSWSLIRSYDDDDDNGKRKKKRY